MKTRFEKKFIPDPNTGCWIWMAALVGRGYGLFRADGRLVRAHRFAYELYVGPILDGLCVLHKCDVPACVNPAHLFLGTQADNIADKCAKGRQASGDRHGSRLHPEKTARGEKIGNAKLTEEQVREIRAAEGLSQQRLAVAFNVDQTLISQIRSRKIWRHV